MKKAKKAIKKVKKAELKKVKGGAKVANMGMIDASCHVQVK